MSPSIFIGSSSEGFQYAEAIKKEILPLYPNCHTWRDEDVFDLSDFTLTSLIKHAHEVDYAIFVLHPDDSLRSREKEMTAIRDNIIFEVGLFMGTLGREKVFLILVKKNEELQIKIPTDWSGINYGILKPEDEENLKKICARIQKNIDDSKKRDLGIQSCLSDLNTTVLSEKLSKAKKIRVLKTFFPEDSALETGLRQAFKNQKASVELFLLDPNSEILKDRSRSIKPTEPDLGRRKVLTAIRLIYDEVYKSGKGRGSVVLFNNWPGCPIVEIDDTFYLGMYLLGTSSPHNPWFEIKPNSMLAQKLSDQFDYIFKNYDPIILDEQEKFNPYL